MKKTIILFVMLLTTAFAWSQTHIKPDYAKGDTVVYDYSVSTNSSSGSMYQNITQQYIVEGANDEGYVIHLNILDYSGNTLTPAMGSESELQQFFKSFDCILQTDSTCNVKRILNYDEVAQKLDKKIKEYYDSMYNKDPEKFKRIVTEKHKKMVKEIYSEDNLIKLLKTNGMFAYYGKTLKTGDKERKVVMGVNVDCTYDVIPSSDTLTVIRKDTVNMSDEDVKEFIQKMSGKSDSSNGNVNVDKMLAFLKAIGGDFFKGTGTVTTHFLPNGWLNDQTIEQNFTILGTEMTLRSRMKIKSADF